IQIEQRLDLLGHRQAQQIAGVGGADFLERVEKRLGRKRLHQPLGLGRGQDQVALSACRKPVQELQLLLEGKVEKFRFASYRHIDGSRGPVSRPKYRGPPRAINQAPVFRFAAPLDKISPTDQGPFLASPNSKHPVALTIAGSDPGGGAGLQADLKTFAALGVYGYSVITEVIAQNSSRVTGVENVSPEMVEAQLDTLALECVPRAVKTGALANAAIVKTVARAIERLKLPAPVVDPVIVSSSGALLIGPKGERAIRKRLIPIARIVTPNI